MTEQNTMFPGRPNYTGPISGVFGFVHHQQLCEPSHDIMERVAYIKSEKPNHEIGIRLHNLIYLGGCEATAKRAQLDADILVYIKTYIPDCAWNGKTLVFT